MKEYIPIYEKFDLVLQVYTLPRVALLLGITPHRLESIRHGLHAVPPEVLEKLDLLIPQKKPYSKRRPKKHRQAKSSA